MKNTTENLYDFKTKENNYLRKILLTIKLFN